MTEAGEASRGIESARRLATIVSIDAAGYSRQSEIDEATAVREITAVGERIKASAASRSGRVFNTAGDGFMLEFPSASAALAAAEELLSVERVPLRIGLHLGEVYDRPDGDLLGKGVNIAARLMALALPGNIVVSADAKRELTPEAAARLRPLGVVRLSKMSERIEAFAVGSPWKQPRTIPGRWILAGAAAMALAAFAWFGGQALFPPRSQAIAVLEFRALEPSLATFSAGLADRLIGAMTENDLQPAQSSAAAAEDRIAAAARTGAAFVLDGTVRTEEEDLLVSARLIDRRGNVAIWSNEYRRIAAEQNYMQEQIAVDVARVLRCTLVGWRQGERSIEAATLSLFLRACDSMGQSYAGSSEAIHQLARQVTEQAPGFSRGWSMRAQTAVWMSVDVPEQEQQALIAEARGSAARARELDASNGESHLAEFYLLPDWKWSERQAKIDQAIAADPDLAAAYWERAWFFNSVGRSGEALRAMRRAVALEPLNADHWAGLPPLLSAVGGNENQREANALRERLYRIWPQSVEAWWNRFFNAAYAGDARAAIEMLDDIDSAPVQMHPLAVERWRSFLAARAAGDSERMRSAALAMRDLIPEQRSSSGAVMSTLSLAGEMDEAFDVAQAIVARGGMPALFMAPQANMRRDPRFMTLIRSSLIQYWRETGRWPDFCADPTLPYDCEETAARALAER